ncbi:unnamed protein product, partial [Arabidopsis halleri]
GLVAWRAQSDWVQFSPFHGSTPPAVINIIVGSLSVGLWSN